MKFFSKNPVFVVFFLIAFLIGAGIGIFSDPSGYYFAGLILVILLFSWWYENWKERTGRQ